MSVKHRIIEQAALNSHAMFQNKLQLMSDR